MKKIVVAIVLLYTVLSFAACGANGEVSDPVSPNYGANGDENQPDGEANAYLDHIAYDREDIEEEPAGIAIVENAYISTAEKNVSTFSADVDTAFYAYFRKHVEYGYSLSELASMLGSTVRTEEMINYFDYNYTVPAEGELFSAQMQIAPCPWNENAKLLVLGLQTEKLETATENNLVFLIDVSGSMGSADKIELLKKTFSYLTNNLGEDDTVSIVTYSGEEKVVLDGCNGAKTSAILDAVNGLEAHGATNGEAGLKMAYQIAEKHYISGGNNRIILASDGDLNVGISSESELEAFVSEKRDSGVFLSVLGFGSGNYKDSKMETIADCGNGIYYYIDGEDEAEKVFGTDLFATLHTVAKDVKLQLTFNEESVRRYRLIGYENRLLSEEDYINDKKDAGELGAGHSLTVCYELELTENAFANESWMTLGVRYKQSDGIKSEERSYSFGTENYTELPDDNFKFVCAVAELGMLLRNSEYIGDMTVSDVYNQLVTVNLGKDKYKAQFLDILRDLTDR